MEQISPTRTELLTRRAQIRLAEQGAKLLRGKREALVREFLTEIKTFRSDRDQMLRNLQDAGKSLMRSIALDSPEAVRSVAIATRREIDIEVTEQNIWGTRVANVESSYGVRTPDQREYSLVAVSARIDETVNDFEKAVESIIRVAPKFHKLGRLAEEIRKTSRRVNALEQRLLPELSEQVQYIRSVLDQREREDIFRLKRIKRKRTA
jgi:V/A-type H+-transporting ATPase subunit D